MKKVIGLGNALVDLMIALPNDSLIQQFNLPKGSMTLIDESKLNEISDAIKGMEITVAAGGSAANTINGLANTGVKTSFIGKIGSDEIGNIFKKDMENNGILPLLGSSSTPSGRAIAFVTPDGERTFATFLGASIELGIEEIKNVDLQDYDIMYIEGYLVQNESLIRGGVQMAKDAGLKVALDLASFNVVEQNIELLQDIMPNIDFVFANEEEAKSYCGLAPEEAVQLLAETCNMAIVKCGASGSLIRTEKNTIKVNAIKATPLDTTGAGDLFAAGFLYGQVSGLSIEKSGMAGSLLAGKVIEVMGAKMNASTWESINNMLLKL